MTNIEKLARMIVRTGNADQIMAALELCLSSGALVPIRTSTDDKEKHE